MKVDFHCHTKKVKSGESDGRNVSADLFFEKINDADIKIAAITNHNLFDYDQYLSLKEKVGNVCQVWPGVELDLASEGTKKFHLIVVANPDNAIDFAIAVEKLFENKNIETDCVEINEVCSRLNCYDVIYICHFHKKPSISEEEFKHLVDIVGDSSRVFGEPQDMRSLGVFTNHNYNMLIGSDVKDWSEYETCTFADLRLPISNFSQLCLLAKRDRTVVNTLLSYKNTYDVIAKPYRDIEIELKIYEEINIIFGQKGTGKSEILNSIYEDMIEKGINCIKYCGSARDDDFKKLLKTNDMNNSVLKIGIDDCSSEFRYIKNWVDINPTNIKKYFDWFKTKDNVMNKSRMKITEAGRINDTDSGNYKDSTNDYSKCQSAINSISNINIGEYLLHDEHEILNNLLIKLEKQINVKIKKEFSEIYKVKLANFSIDKIKDIADKNSNTVSKPSTTGFFEFANNRLSLRKSVEKIVSFIEHEPHFEKESIGDIEGKGEIFIQNRYRMLGANSRASEFKKNITQLKKISKLLVQIFDNACTNNLTTNIKEFNDLCSEDSISSLEYFIGLSKIVVLEDNSEYIPSNGERGILLLQKVLSSDADAYFLDEPELGMGNSYIDTNIRPKIVDLAKKHKTVIVATHNANIAVRTLPYLSIFRTHFCGEYKTYLGNPFNDLLVNIKDENEVLGWTEESIHTLEGGRAAFYERKDIYESGNNRSKFNN